MRDFFIAIGILAVAAAAIVVGTEFSIKSGGLTDREQAEIDELIKSTCKRWPDIKGCKR